MKKTILVLLILIILINVISPGPDCRYTTYSGSFTFIEDNYKQRNFEMCMAKFTEFKKENVADSILYRLTSKDYRKFWNYSAYFFSDKFDLPFISWDSVAARRGIVSNKSGFQDF